MALAIVIFEKQMKRVNKGVAPALPAGPTNEEKLLIDIRDAIKGRHYMARSRHGVTIRRVVGRLTFPSA